MNTDTKRHIDSARQVLVGVVPNPTSQIDQITNALVYKFMDDMDQAAIKTGGSPSFFVGDLERYAWTRLMDSRMGNQERMNLYQEALMKFSESKQLPELFRGIFKSAFLPYRSPETLGLFLKEIDYFDYSHPEELGNAYEYLLSIMSSQGDAGQFRTPRHIIDFIVDVVNPTKDDKVLDPACGTGGFLVSSYKHILAQHDGKDDPEKQEKPLNPDDRRNLMNNFEGYDIDPGMVRIAQVNMYLHQFKNPKIYQYDSLSSEERWSDKFDVILANPPFMSPKGGIKPHSKFGVQSNRSEVLFADYIMNHLRPNGRAGIIVPEGIIFQSGTAYKQLRKNLVEDGLFCVVSLPPGVFNPYAGVKTSILLFDNEIAKKSVNILFVKIQNDGFDLGSQRKIKLGSELPMAIEAINGYNKYIRESNTLEQIPSIPEVDTNPLCQLIIKEKIAESGDYNLSGDRYKENNNFINRSWPFVDLDSVCKISSGDSAPQSDDAFEDGEIPFVRMKDLGHYHLTVNLRETNDLLNKNFVEQKGISIWPKGSILIPKSGSVYLNHRAILGVNAAVVGHIAVLSNFEPIILNTYLYYVLKLIDIGKMASRTSGLDAISLALLKKVKIPLPPVEVQKEIIEQIEVKQNAIDHAKAIIKSLERERRYFGQTLRKLKDVEWVELGKLFEKVSEQINPQNKIGSISYIGLENIESNSGNLIGKMDAEMETIKSTKNVFKTGDILYGKLRPNLNKVWFADRDGICSTDILVLRGKDKKISSQLYAVILRNEEFNSDVLKGLRGAQLPRVSFDYISTIKIPQLTEGLQEEYLNRLNDENDAVRSNRKLIEIYEQKIADVLKEV